MTTTKPTRPKLSDPRLQQALDKAADHVEGFQVTLDKISDDIKALEKYLEASAIRVEFRVSFGASGIVTDDPVDVLGNYSGTIHQDEEYVEWAPVDGDTRWRIMYKKIRSEGELEMCEEIVIAGPRFNGQSRVVERKPLIETPLEVRLRAYQALPDFLEAIPTTTLPKNLQIPFDPTQSV